MIMKFFDFLKEEEIYGLRGGGRGPYWFVSPFTTKDAAKVIKWLKENDCDVVEMER